MWTKKTIVKVDLADSTTLAARLRQLASEHGDRESAEELAKLYELGKMYARLQVSNGILLHSEGDGCVVAFNNSQEGLDFAKGALDDIYSEPVKTLYGQFSLEARIGIATGEIFLTDLSEHYFAYGEALEQAELAEKSAPRGTFLLYNEVPNESSFSSQVNNINGFVAVPSFSHVAAMFMDFEHLGQAIQEKDELIAEEIICSTYEVVRDITVNHQGYLDKFKVAGSLLFFGAPEAVEQPARKAILAYAQIKKNLENLCADYDLDFSLPIGVCTGKVWAGPISNSFTIIGPEVNIAARLLQKAKPKQLALVEEITYQSLESGVLAIGPQELELKGISNPVNTYSIISVGDFSERHEKKMIGREDDYLSLQQYIFEAGFGFGKLIGVKGEPGVGKSRLIHELANYCSEQDFVVIKASFSPESSHISFDPIVKVMVELLDISEGDTNTNVKNLGEDDQLVINKMLGLPTEKDISVDDMKNTFKSIIYDKTNERNLAIFFSDLHWADKDSVDLLYSIERDIEHKNLLVFCDYRPQFTGFKREHELAKLSNEYLIEIAKQYSEGGHVSDNLKGIITQYGNGNPLFAQEIVKRGLHGQDMVIPETIEDVIMQNFKQLDREAKQVMEIAAVVGEIFSVQILELVQGKVVQKSLEKLIDKKVGVIHHLDKENFEFHHALFKEVAYSRLTKKRRKDLHKQVGKAIIALYHNDMHKRGQMEGHFQKVLELLEKQDADGTRDERAELLMDVGNVYIQIGNGRKALNFYNQAYEIVEDQHLLCRANYAMGISLQFLHENNNALKYFKQAAEVCQDAPYKVRILHAHGLSLYHLGQETADTKFHYEAIDKYEELEQLVAELPEQESNSRVKINLALAFNAHGTIHRDLGDYATALPLLQRSLDLSREIDYKQAEAMVLDSFGVCFFNQDEVSQALEYFMKSYEITTSFGFKRENMENCKNIGRCKLRLSQREEAKNYYQEGLKLAEEFIDHKSINEIKERLKEI